jgi:Zn finger protein HypA/HybF involved in hydrogenase expression
MDNIEKWKSGTVIDRMIMIEQRLKSIEINQMLKPTMGASGKIVFSGDPESRYCGRCRRELSSGEIAFLVGDELLCEKCVKVMYKCMTRRKKRIDEANA